MNKKVGVIVGIILIVLLYLFVFRFSTRGYFGPQDRMVSELYPPKFPATEDSPIVLYSNSVDMADPNLIKVPINVYNPYEDQRVYIETDVDCKKAFRSLISRRVYWEDLPIEECSINISSSDQRIPQSDYHTLDLEVGDMGRNHKCEIIIKAYAGDNLIGMEMLTLVSI